MPCDCDGCADKRALPLFRRLWVWLRPVPTYVCEVPDGYR